MHYSDARRPWGYNIGSQSQDALWICTQIPSEKVYLVTNFGHVCTLTLKILPSVKVMTHTWFIDNSCVKCLNPSYPYKEVQARTLMQAICTVRYEAACLGSRSEAPFAQKTTILWSIIQITGAQCKWQILTRFSIFVVRELRGSFVS